MANKELQIENGNFTQIINPLIEALIRVPFKGCEFQVAMFIIRKTYGYKKKQDSISLSQFVSGLDRGRPTVVKALANLQLVNIVKLVKKGNAKGACNIWEINKYTETWKLVNVAKLVKTKRQPSSAVYTKPSKDGLTHKRKKERVTKEIPEPSSGNSGMVIDLFKEINPSYKNLFSRKPQHEASVRLIEREGYEKIGKIVKFIEMRRSDKYCPQISSPYQLEEKWSALEKYALGLKGDKDKHKVAF